MKVRKIGAGGCSQVWLARRKSSGQQFAIKVIDTSRIPEKLWRRELEVTAIVNSIKHENLLSYEGFFSEENMLYLVMELVTGRDLGACIGDKQFSPKLVANIIFQVVDTILSLDEKGVMYRDLKPDNIMFAPCSHDKVRIKLCDYSHAVVCRTDRRATQSGTPCYVSPEIAQGRYYGVNQANIYPLGIIAHELLTLKLPFKEESTNSEFVFQIKTGQVALGLKSVPCKMAQKFVKDVLLRRRPKKLELVLEHPFLQKYCSKSRQSKFLPKLKTRSGIKRKKMNNEFQFTTPFKKKQKIDHL